MKRVCLFHQNAAQVALSAKKAPPPVILIVFSEYHQDLAKRALFVSRELLITLHPAGCQALRWAHWLPSHVWKVIFVPPILLLLWAVASVFRDTTVLKIHRTLFKHLQGPLLVTKEAPLLEVYVSQVHFHHGRDKSAALPVQREAPVSAMAPMCLAFVGPGPIDQKPTRRSASHVLYVRILLLAA